MVTHGTSLGGGDSPHLSSRRSRPFLDCVLLGNLIRGRNPLLEKSNTRIVVMTLPWYILFCPGVRSTPLFLSLGSSGMKASTLYNNFEDSFSQVRTTHPNKASGGLTVPTSLAPVMRGPKSLHCAETVASSSMQRQCHSGINLRTSRR